AAAVTFLLHACEGRSAPDPAAFLSCVLHPHQSFISKKMVTNPRAKNRAPPMTLAVWDTSETETASQRSTAPSKREASAKARPSLSNMNLTLTSADAEALKSPWTYAFVRNRGARISRSASRFVKTGGL